MCGENFGEKEMANTEKIVGYLKKTYQPDAVIVYGSFAD